MKINLLKSFRIIACCAIAFLSLSASAAKPMKVDKNDELLTGYGLLFTEAMEPIFLGTDMFDDFSVFYNGSNMVMDVTMKPQFASSMGSSSDLRKLMIASMSNAYNPVLEGLINAMEEKGANWLFNVKCGKERRTFNVGARELFSGSYDSDDYLNIMVKQMNDQKIELDEGIIDYVAIREGNNLVLKAYTTLEDNEMEILENSFFKDSMRNNLLSDKQMYTILQAFKSACPNSDFIFAFIGKSGKRVDVNIIGNDINDFEEVIAVEEPLYTEFTTAPSAVNELVSYLEENFSDFEEFKVIVIVDENTAIYYMLIDGSFLQNITDDEFDLLSGRIADLMISHMGVTLYKDCVAENVGLIIVAMDDDDMKFTEFEFGKNL